VTYLRESDEEKWLELADNSMSDELEMDDLFAAVLDVCGVTFAGRVSAFANNLGSAFRSFTVGATEVFPFFGDATTSGIFTFLRIRQVEPPGHANGIPFIRC
jgi:hypothetical protein